MPYAVLIGTPDRSQPTFVIPRWTRRAADTEAALARTKRGIGFIITPYLSLPGQVHDEHLWAEVFPVGWPAFLRWKAGGERPGLAALGWTGRLTDRPSPPG